MTLPYYLRDKFEWSESGRKLLEIFQERINYYGGLRYCTNQIERENNPRVKPLHESKNCQAWHPSEDAYLKDNYLIIPTNRIAFTLKRSRAAIVTRASRLRRTV